MDATSETRLSQVHPILAAKIRKVALYLSTTYNNEVRVTQALRGIDVQNSLYTLGRTVLRKPDGSPQGIVTNARAGYSWHNFGLAVDLCPDKIDGAPWTPDWAATDLHYTHMVAAGEAQGLEAGAHWHTITDVPHFQLPHLTSAPTDADRALIAKVGLGGYWASLKVVA